METPEIPTPFEILSSKVSVLASIHCMYVIK